MHYIIYSSIYVFSYFVMRHVADIMGQFHSLGLDKREPGQDFGCEIGRMWHIPNLNALKYC